MRRAIDHRQAVFEPQLVRLDAQRQARHGGVTADLLGQHLVEARCRRGCRSDRGSPSRPTAGSSGRGAGWWKTTPSGGTARGGKRGLRGSAPAAARPGRIPWRRRCLSPTSEPVRRRSKSRRTRTAAAACSHRPPSALCVLRKERQRFHPGQRQSDARASQKVTPRCLRSCSSSSHSLIRILHRRAAATFDRRRTLFPSRRLRNCLLVTISAASCENVASPPAATMRSISG